MQATILWIVSTINKFLFFILFPPWFWPANLFQFLYAFRRGHLHETGWLALSRSISRNLPARGVLPCASGGSSEPALHSSPRPPELRQLAGLASAFRLTPRCTAGSESSRNFSRKGGGGAGLKPRTSAAAGGSQSIWISSRARWMDWVECHLEKTVALDMSRWVGCDCVSESCWTVCWVPFHLALLRTIFNQTPHVTLKGLPWFFSPGDLRQQKLPTEGYGAHADGSSLTSHAETNRLGSASRDGAGPQAEVLQR